MTFPRVLCVRVCVCLHCDTQPAAVSREQDPENALTSSLCHFPFLPDMFRRHGADTPHPPNVKTTSCSGRK